MRSTSADKAKGTRAGSSTCNLIPQEGTRLRAIYDRLKAAPATPLSLSLDFPLVHVALQQLRDFYGLDIRTYCEPRHRTPDHRGRAFVRHWLVGEWFGPTYIDYVADRHTREHRQHDRLNNHPR